MSSHRCNCGRQIVWYFDKPTVYVCAECEIALHYSIGECPRCKGKVTAFTCEHDDIPDDDVD